MGNFSQDTLYGISLNFKYCLTKFFKQAYDTSLEFFWNN